MRIAKILSAIGGVALAAGLIPYRFRSDKEKGSYEVGGLLWSLKKDRGEEKDNYTVELLPFIGKQNSSDEAQETADQAVEEAAEEAGEAVEEAAADEAAAEASAPEQAE